MRSREAHAGALPRRMPGPTRLVRRFRRHQGGATAVEFALVALPFFALLFAIIEAALTFWTTQVLETAVADASRQLYTGQFQNDQTSKGVTDPAQLATNFRDLVCGQKVVLAMFSNCKGKLKINVQTMDAFPTGVPSPITTDASGNRVFDPNFVAYQPPGANKIVVVRAALEYPVFVSILGADGSNFSSRTRYLMASAAFKTEPYQ